VRRERAEKSKLVSEGGINSQSVGNDSPFSPRSFLDRIISPKYFGFTDEPPYVGRRDHMTARSDYNSNDSCLRDVLELITKRLDNLEHRKYFPSLSEVDNHARIAASSVANSAALAATRAASSADTASKSVTAAAAACQSAVAATIKLTSRQKNTACMNIAGIITADMNTTGMKTAGIITAGINTAGMTTAGINSAGIITAPCPATPERINSYYDVRDLGSILEVMSELV